MNEERYRQQHQRRLSYMPWLYHRLKPRHRDWAVEWQRQIQAELEAVETVRFGENCFVAPEAGIFAEPGRDIITGDRCLIAADVFMHGPVHLGDDVSINHGVTLDGGSGGIEIGAGTRIAARCTLYAFNHGMAPGTPVREQPVSSRGIRIGADVWLGAGVGVVDGVHIGDGTVVGMGSVVTRDLPAGVVAAGNPARIIRAR